MSDGYVNLPVVGGGGGGADQDLANLTSPTAINQNLLFGADGVKNIGAAGASRPNKGFFKTSVVIGSNATPITIDVGEGSGTNNIRVGFDALTGTGNQNTVVGDEVQIPHGSQNTCFGYNSGPNSAYSANGYTSVGANCGNGTTGSNNTYMGASVVSGAVSSGSNNAFFGNQAGAVLTTGSANVVMGESAANTLTTGTNNVIIGQAAGNASTTDSNNTLVGQGAGAVGSGAQNTYIGQQAGYQATGSNNTFVGQTAGSTGYGLGPLTGNQNILLGYQCTPTTEDASYQCVLGGTNEIYFYNSLMNVPIDLRQIGLFFPGVVGTNEAITSGDVNFWGPQGTGTGHGGDFIFNVAPAGTSGSTNNARIPVFKMANTGVVTIGNASKLGTHGVNGNLSVTGSLISPTVAFGLPSTPVGITQGGSSTNLLVGYQAGANFAGSQTTMIGSGPAANGTGGDTNVFIGYHAGYNNSSGGLDVIIGANAAVNLTTAANSVLIGEGIGSGITTNGSNVGIGSGSVFNLLTSTNNVAIGYQSMPVTTSGGGNVALGSASLNLLTTGSGNVAVGYGAGSNRLTTGSFNILLGENADPSTASSSNQAVFQAITDVFFGSSTPVVTPTALTIHTSQASGSNVSASAGTLTFNGAVGTGTGVGGDIVFQTAPAGSTGSSLNTLASVMSIANTGIVTIGANSGTAQHVLNTSSATSASTGAHGDVPAQVDGYIVITINGSTKKIPYYN